jgi:hypothetical protein
MCDVDIEQPPVVPQAIIPIYGRSSDLSSACSAFPVVHQWQLGYSGHGIYSSGYCPGFSPGSLLIADNFFIVGKPITSQRYKYLTRNGNNSI